jgi:transcriptional regulator with XRE-family HTH domain
MDHQLPAKALGPWLRQRREEKKLTQKELGEIIGQTGQYVWMLENGQRGQSITQETFEELCDALSLDANDEAVALGIDFSAQGERRFAELARFFATSMGGIRQLLPEWTGRTLAALGQNHEAIPRYNEALKQLKPGEADRRGRILCDLGLSLIDIASYRDAEDALSEALKIFTDQRNPIWQARTALNLNFMNVQRGQFATALQLTSLYAPPRGDNYGLAKHRYGAAQSLMYLGHLEDAHDAARESLSFAIAARARPKLGTQYVRDFAFVGGWWRERLAHGLLGNIAVHQGDWNRARREFGMAMKLAVPHGPSFDIAYSSEHVFQLWAEDRRENRMDEEELRMRFRQRLDSMERRGLWWQWVILSREWGWMMIRRGRDADARETFFEVIPVAERHGHQYELAWLHLGLSLAYARMNLQIAATEHRAISAAYATRCGVTIAAPPPWPAEEAA